MVHPSRRERKRWGVLADGPSQRRAVKSAGPDGIRACCSARIGAPMQRPPARAEAGCTWQRGGPTGRVRAFVGIPLIRPHRQDWSTRSHVHIGGSAHMGAVDQPRQASESRGIMRKIDIHPRGAPLSHVQPFCAAPQSDLGAAAAPSRTRRRTTTRPGSGRMPSSRDNAWTASGHLDPGAARTAEAAGARCPAQMSVPRRSPELGRAPSRT